MSNPLGVVRMSLKGDMQFRLAHYGDNQRFTDIEIVHDDEIFVTMCFISEKDRLAQMEMLGEMLLKHVAANRPPLLPECPPPPPPHQGPFVDAALQQQYDTERQTDLTEE